MISTRESSCSKHGFIKGFLTSSGSQASISHSPSSQESCRIMQGNIISLLISFNSHSMQYPTQIKGSSFMVSILKEHPIIKLISMNQYQIRSIKLCPSSISYLLIQISHIYITQILIMHVLSIRHQKEKGHCQPLDILLTL